MKFLTLFSISRLKTLMKEFLKKLRSDLSKYFKDTRRSWTRNLKRNRNEKGIDRLIESVLEEIFAEKKNRSWVTSTIKPKFNYVLIDLTEHNGWTKGPEQLAKEITALVKKRAEASGGNEAFFRKFNNISFHIIDGDAEPYDENCQVFYGFAPLEHVAPRPKNLGARFWGSIWTWPTLLAISATLLLSYFSVRHFYKATEEELKKIVTINQNINFVTGIFGSFIMTFLMTRVLNLRQEKLKRAPLVRALSDKLGQFQKVCFHLVNDDHFWNNSKAYQYAKSIKDRISYWDARGVKVGGTDEEFHYYQSLMTAPKHDNRVIWLYLQLNMFANMHAMKNLDLLYTKHPPIRIFTAAEIDDFLVFCQFNELESYLNGEDINPVYSAGSNAGKNIVAAAKLFDPEKFKESVYSKDLLIDMADQVQNRVLPDLYNVLTLNEAKLPLSVSYYFFAVVGIVILTVIWPVIFNLFFSNQLYLNIGSILLLGLFVHILLMFRRFLTLEANLKRPDDYR